KTNSHNIDYRRSRRENRRSGLEHLGRSRHLVYSAPVDTNIWYPNRARLSTNSPVCRTGGIFRIDPAPAHHHGPSSYASRDSRWIYELSSWISFTLRVPHDSVPLCHHGHCASCVPWKS